MDRRQFLRAAGAGGVAGVAGCASVLGDRSDGPASFAVSVSGPSSVPVGESFSVEVAVTNTGGTAGGFRAPVTVDRASGAVVASVVVRDVAPGETTSRTVGPWRVRDVGEYVVRVASVDARHAVRGVPAERRGGEAFSLAGVTLSVSDVTYGGRFRHSGGDVVAPPSGAVFAYVHVRAAAPSVAAAPAPRTVRVVAGDDALPPAPDAALPGGKSPYRPAAAVADGGTSGWLRYAVPADAVTATPGVEFVRDGDAVARWTFDDVATAVPRFAVRRVTTPSPLEVGQPGEVAAVVANVGSGSGTYYGTLVADAGDEQARYPLSGPVAAGATERVTATLAAPTTDPVVVRVRPDGATARFRPVDPVIEPDASYRSPAGWTLAVTDAVADGDSFVYRTASENVTALADRGTRLVFVRFTVRNPTDHEQALPPHAVLETAGGLRVRDVTPGAYADRRLVAPFDGALWTDHVAAHAVADRWHVFEVPANASLAPFRVHVEDPGTVGGDPVHVAFRRSVATT